MPSFFRPFFFFDRRPLSRRPAGPLYLSYAEQRDGEHRDIAPGAGLPPIATEKPKPIRRKKPRRLPRRSSSAPLVARRPRPKTSRGASSLRRTRNRDVGRFGQSVPKPLRLIRRSGRKTPAISSGWFVFWVATPRRHEERAPPPLRSVAHATVPSSAAFGSSHTRSGARPAALPTGLAGEFGFGSPAPGRPSTWPLPRAVGVFSAPLLGTSKAFHPSGRAHFKDGCPISATCQYIRPRGQNSISEGPGAALQKHSRARLPGKARLTPPPRLARGPLINSKSP